MRIRSALALISVSAVLSACGNIAGPMACEGNPKCKADLQPIEPTQLRIQPAAAAPNLVRNSSKTLAK